MKILHLYPNLMNMYGDYGNITVLVSQLKDQGIDVDVDKKDIEDDIDFSQYDFIYMGAGTESKLNVALDNLMKYKDDLKACVENGKVVLFTGNAMELLGKTIDDRNALGIFSYESKHTDKRFTGDVIVKNDKLGEIVGFINKSSITSGDSEHKLFEYVFKDNNLSGEEYEGYTVNSAYATHIIGPILVKNPSFMKAVIRSLAPADFKYKDIDYPFIEDSYEVTLNALKGRK